MARITNQDLADSQEGLRQEVKDFLFQLEVPVTLENPEGRGIDIDRINNALLAWVMLVAATLGQEGKLL